MRLQPLLTTTAALALFAGAASAQTPAGSEYSFSLSSRQPGSPSGMSIRVVYRRPGDPDAKPPALEALALGMPAGLRFDTSVTPTCEASDAEFRMMGRAACPPGSRVGSGALTAVTGTPGADPVETDTTIFNGGDEFVELVSFKGTDVTAGMDRLTIEDGRLVAHPPATPGGPPDGRTTVREISLTIEERGSLITTPPECPRAGSWTSLLTFKFAGYDESSLLGSTPCTASTTPAGREARMSLSVRPRRVRAGRRVVVRARLHSSAPACRAAVRVRLGRRRAVTNRRGRAGIAVRFTRRGRRLVRASKPGCGSARAWIVVR